MKTKEFTIFLQKLLNYIARLFMALSRKLGSRNSLTLSGDRDIEWSWVLANLPQDSTVLDFGPGPFQLISSVAARKGCNVTCFDVRCSEVFMEMDNINYVYGDVSYYDFKGQKFDCITNASTIEHVGLTRYGDSAVNDGDIKAMSLLRSLLKPKGRMLLTIPVGKDTVHGHLHRVYGNERLPMLLNGFLEVKCEFWIKSNVKVWQRVSKELALQTKSTPYYYALGLFVLEPRVQ